MAKRKRKSFLSEVVCDDPVRMGILLSSIESNTSSIRDIGVWLKMDPHEKLINAYKYPEFEFLGDDDLLKDMVIDFWSVLN